MRRVTRSEKEYRCPGCDHEIRPGTTHLVAWAEGDEEGRRHWHTGCWESERRRDRQLLEAGINIAPPALFVLGIGGLAFDPWPRGSIGVACGLVVWSFVVETFASASNENHWLRDTSPLTHNITPAPAANLNVTSTAQRVGLEVLAALVGIVGFGRRDLAGAQPSYHQSPRRHPPRITKRPFCAIGLILPGCNLAVATGWAER